MRSRIFISLLALYTAFSHFYELGPLFGLLVE